MEIIRKNSLVERRGEERKLRVYLPIQGVTGRTRRLLVIDLVLSTLDGITSYSLRLEPELSRAGIP
jgi:hypothetical protein